MIDLVKMFGVRFKVVRKSPDGKRSMSLWDAIILGGRGHVYVHSATHLGLALDGCHRVINRIIREDPDFLLVQDGDDGANFVFIPSEETMQRATKYALLRHKRVVSEEQKVELAERLATYRRASKRQDYNDFVEVILRRWGFSGRGLT